MYLVPICLLTLFAIGQSIYISTLPPSVGSDYCSTFDPSYSGYANYFYGVILPGYSSIYTQTGCLAYFNISLSSLGNLANKEIMIQLDVLSTQYTPPILWGIPGSRNIIPPLTYTGYDVISFGKNKPLYDYTNFLTNSGSQYIVFGSNSFMNSRYNIIYNETQIIIGVYKYYNGSSYTGLSYGNLQYKITVSTLLTSGCRDGCNSNGYCSNDICSCYSQSYMLSTYPIYLDDACSIGSYFLTSAWQSFVLSGYLTLSHVTNNFIPSTLFFTVRTLAVNSLLRLTFKPVILNANFGNGFPARIPNSFTYNLTLFATFTDQNFQVDITNYQSLWQNLNNANWGIWVQISNPSFSSISYSISVGQTSDLSAGAIAGIVIGCLALILIGVLIGQCIRRRRRVNAQLSNQSNSQSMVVIAARNNQVPVYSSAPVNVAAQYQPVSEPIYQGQPIMPQQMYSQPQNFAQSQPIYGQPQQMYGQPQQMYGQPQQNYAQPQQNYGQPQIYTQQIYN